MKNRLIPLERCAHDTAAKPALVPHNYKYRTLIPSPEGGRWTDHDHQGFSWRDDLNGKIENQVGPAIEIDDGGLFMIQNMDEFLSACRPFQS